MVEAIQVTVTDTSTLIYAAGGRARVRLQSVATFYVGPTGSVTTSTGYPVGSVTAFDRVFDIEAGDSLYGIMPAAGSADVRVLALS